MQNYLLFTSRTQGATAEHPHQTEELEPRRMANRADGQKASSSINDQVSALLGRVSSSLNDRIPPEIRNMIYENVDIMDVRVNKQGLPLPPLLWTSKLNQAEFLPVIFKNTSCFLLAGMKDSIGTMNFHKRREAWRVKNNVPIERMPPLQLKLVCNDIPDLLDVLAWSALVFTFGFKVDCEVYLSEALVHATNTRYLPSPHPASLVSTFVSFVLQDIIYYPKDGGWKELVDYAKYTWRNECSDGLPLGSITELGGILDNIESVVVEGIHDIQIRD